LTKTPLIHSFHVSIWGGAWSFVWRTKPIKARRCDGLGLGQVRCY